MTDRADRAELVAWLHSIGRAWENSYPGPRSEKDLYAARAHAAADLLECGGEPQPSATPELVEKVARALALQGVHLNMRLSGFQEKVPTDMQMAVDEGWENFLSEAECAVTAILPAVERAALEKAAQTVDAALTHALHIEGSRSHALFRAHFEKAAAAIRALAPPQTEEK